MKAPWHGFHHVTPNRRWQIINVCVCVCVCMSVFVCRRGTDWCACQFIFYFFFYHELLFIFCPGAIFTLPCQPFHTELGHEGCEFRSGCGALTHAEDSHINAVWRDIWISESTGHFSTLERSQWWRQQDIRGEICPSPFALLKGEKKRKIHLILVRTPSPQPLLWKWDARMVISGW